MDNLYEGIKYFKNSDKLRNLVSKMEHNLLNNIADEKQRDELREYIKNVKEATKEFEMVEKEYSTGDKKAAKLLYKRLKNKYGQILARVDRPLLDIFKKYGSSMLYFATIQIFSMLFLPKIKTMLDKVIPQETI